MRRPRCACGCGRWTVRIKETNSHWGHIKGKWFHYLRWHHPHRGIRWTGALPRCECGCGRKVSCASQTARRDGYIKGQPLRFIRGHNGRKNLGRGFNPATAYRIKNQPNFPSPCWIWTRGLSNGRGTFTRRKRIIYAHRYFYELRFGFVRGGLELDHLCAVKRCVNPDHLEAVTASEHGRRSRRAHFPN
jgi:hypothetical protein